MTLKDALQAPFWSQDLNPSPSAGTWTQLPGLASLGAQLSLAGRGDRPDFRGALRLWPGRTELVFVEVRARLPGAWVSGVESVAGAKLQALRSGVAALSGALRGASLRGEVGSAGLGWRGWGTIPSAWDV